MERRIHHSIYELLPTGSATLVTWAAAGEQNQSAAAATSSGLSAIRLASNQRPTPGLGGLEQLDRVAGWILQQDLLATVAVTTSLRNCPCGVPSRATVSGRSSTSIRMRFQPPGAGEPTVGHGLPGHAAPGRLSSSRSAPRETCAKPSAGCRSSRKPRSSV